jgi:hypothetical protein
MNMLTGSVNYLAVLVAAAVYFLLGALWYSKLLFANTWMKGVGKTDEQIKEGFSRMAFLWSFIWSFVAVYGVARILVWAGGDSAADGFLAGLLIGVCFVLAVFVINNLFEKRPKGFMLINAFYHVVAFIISGLIIGAWR